MPESQLSFVRKSTRRRYALYRCSCGTEKEIFTTNVTGGRVVSCGCHRRKVSRKKNLKHGFAANGAVDPVYQLWRNMLDRCSRCKFYTSRGITVCSRWASSFTDFRNDVGVPPADKSLDRINNDHGYWCGNANCADCGPARRDANWHWATRIEQARNTIRNHIVAYDGKSQCIAAWASDLGMTTNKLWKRLKRGWSAEKALTTP